MPQAARRRDGARSHLKRNPIHCIAAALAAALVSTSAAGAAPAKKPAPAHACDLYRALDRRCGCASGGTRADNYFGGYGEKYCERFMRSGGWSAAGLRWRAQTLSCLKDE